MYKRQVRDNLIALREIAMRRCADRINLITSTANKAFSKEHIMVCLGASPTNQKVIRTAARMVPVSYTHLLTVNHT